MSKISKQSYKERRSAIRYFLQYGLMPPWKPSNMYALTSSGDRSIWLVFNDIYGAVVGKDFVKIKSNSPYIHNFQEFANRLQRKFLVQKRLSPTTPMEEYYAPNWECPMEPKVGEPAPKLLTKQGFVYDRTYESLAAIVSDQMQSIALEGTPSFRGIPVTRDQEQVMDRTVTYNPIIWR